jgi:hypothetical protein
MNNFNKTDKQKEAIKLLSGPAKRIMLFGGSRSGKTAILIYALFVRALKKKADTLFSGFDLIMQKHRFGMTQCQKLQS